MQKHLFPVVGIEGIKQTKPLILLYEENCHWSKHGCLDIGLYEKATWLPLVLPLWGAAELQELAHPHLGAGAPQTAMEEGLGSDFWSNK